MGLLIAKSKQFGNFPFEALSSLYESLVIPRIMDSFTYILLSVWFAWCQVFISGKLIHACYIHALVFNCRGGVMCASLWLLLGCVRIVLIRILYSLFLDERGIYHYLLQLTKCVLCVLLILCEPCMKSMKI